jgi:hypothetical protein
VFAGPACCSLRPRLDSRPERLRTDVGPQKGLGTDELPRADPPRFAIVNERQPDVDLRVAVIVPVRPGPLVRLGDLERGRDEVEELLDDLFGPPDDRGPSPADAVLVLGGLGAIIGGQVASLPTIVTVCGAAAVALGAVLPLRSLWRNLTSARRARRLQSLLGDGVLLRTDHASVEQLFAAHHRLSSLTATLAPAPRARVQAVAHAALLEVASLLGGRVPGAEEEIDYVSARTRALENLVATLADPRVGDGEAARRRAYVEARREVEKLTGSSSLTDASELSRELLVIDDA